MIEKTKTVTISKPYYVAEDGTEFSDMCACISYEDDLHKKAAKKKIESIPHFVYTPDLVENDCTWEWYFVANEPDFSAVKAWNHIEDGFSFDYTINEYPCWIAVSTDSFDNSSCIVGNVTEFGNMLRECYEGLTAAINAHQKEN